MADNSIELTCVESNTISGFNRRKVSIDADQIASFEEVPSNPQNMRTHIITKMTQSVYDDEDKMGIENVTFSVEEDYDTVNSLIAVANKS